MAQTALAFDALDALDAFSAADAARQHRPSPVGRAPVLPVAAPAPAAAPGAAADQAPCPFEVALAIGRDHARHGLVPPAEHLLPGHPVRQGWEAARPRFAQRSLPAGRPVRQWLALRLQAWQRGQAFEEVQVTPNFLAQIDTPRCPITRQPLDDQGGDNTGVPERIGPGTAWAAGNLAVLSRRAQQAKGSLRWDDARLRAVLAESRPNGLHEGLSSAQWGRLACLMSLVTPLPHELAASLPLLVLPPNRLRLLNPIQGLQALVTLQLTRPGYAARIARLVSCLPGATLRRDFQLFFHSLLPRAWDGGHTQDPAELRLRLEDAWRQPLVLRRWQRFAAGLSLAQTEALLQRAVALGLGGQRIETHTEQQATEGWGLAPIGRLPVVAPGTPGAPAAPAAAPAPAAPLRPAQKRPQRLHALTVASAQPGPAGCHTC